MLRPASARLRFLALCLASLAAFFGPRAEAASTNLLINPGFEKGLGDHPWMPTGWDTSRAGFSSVFFGRDTLSPHGGLYSVSVANASGIYPLAHNWSQTLLVDRSLWGKDLVFSVWTRTLGVEGRAYLKIEAYRDTVGKMAKTWGVTREAAFNRLQMHPIDDPLLNLGWKRLFFSDAETDWVKREVRVFIPPTVSVVYVRCGLIGTGQLMLDDASLTAEAPAPSNAPAIKANLLSDSGFEGDCSAWEYSLPPYPDMRMGPQTNVVHSGKAALIMSSPAVGMVQARTGASQVLNERALAGRHLLLTSFAKADSLGSSAFVSLYCQTLSGVVQNVSTSMISGTSGWTPLSVDIDAPADTYSVWAWLCYTSPTTGRVYFDDASLSVTDKGTALKP